jgi:hypothetical protein
MIIDEAQQPVRHWLLEVFGILPSWRSRPWAPGLLSAAPAASSHWLRICGVASGWNCKPNARRATRKAWLGKVSPVASNSPPSGMENPS